MGHLVTETTETGALIKDYIWNEMHPVAQIDAVIPAQAGIQSIETITYLYTDHLMTNRLATDSNGIIIWRWEGEAFGNTPAQELGTISVNLRFPGQYYDQENNLHYNLNRYYDPAIGRYITSDPIGLDAGLNTYNYVYANSLRFADESGLKIMGEWTNGGLRTKYGGIEFLGMEVITPYIDWATFVNIVRFNFKASGTVIAPVKCTDDSNCNEWEITHYIPIEKKAHKDWGPNIIAGVVSSRFGWQAGLATSVGLGLVKGMYGAYEAYKKYSEAASLVMSILNSFGPDYICNYGIPELPNF